MGKVFSSGSARVLDCSVSSVAGDDHGSGWEPDDAKRRRPGNDPDYYIDILRLDEIMMGEKLGVQEHHCEKLLKKLPKSHPDKSRLSLHLEKVVLAKKLRESSLDTLQEVELNKAVDEIICKGEIAAPTHLQDHLLDRAVRGCICAGVVDAKGVQALFGVVQPWPSSGMPFDVHAPKLRDMPLGLDDKCKRFVNVIYKEVALPLIKAGEGSKEKAGGVLTALLDLLGDLLNEEDLSDLCVRRAMTLADCCKCVRALCEDKLEYQVGCSDDLFLLSKSSGTTGKNWQTQVANEITREPWYSKRMMEVLATMQTAREAVEGMEAHLVGLEKMESDIQTKLTTVAGFCKDLTAWEAQLSSPSLAQFKEKLGAVTDDLAKQVSAAVDANAFNLADVTKVQSALLEFSYAFPEASSLQGTLAAVVSYASLCRGKCRLQTLFGAACALSDHIKKEEDNLTAQLESLHASLRSCEGLAFKVAAEQEAMRGHVETWLHAAWACSASPTTNSLARVILAVLPFLAVPQRNALQPEAEVLVKFGELATAVGKWEHQVASLVSDLVAGTWDPTPLRTLQQNHAALESLPALSQGGSATKVVALLEKACGLITAASTEVQAHYRAKVDDATVALDAEMDKALMDGRDWRDTLKNNTWKDYSVLAAQQLQKMSPDATSNAISVLEASVNEYSKQMGAFFAPNEDDGGVVKRSNDLLSKARLASATCVCVVLLDPKQSADKVATHRALKQHQGALKKQCLYDKLDAVLREQLEKHLRLK